MYLGGMVTEDGHSAAEVRRRTQAGANAWRKVEGVMLDRTNLEKAERESPENECYTSMPVWSGDVDRTTTTTTTEAAHLLENCVRRITRTKRMDRRRMNDLRKEVGMIDW